MVSCSLLVFLSVVLYIYTVSCNGEVFILILLIYLCTKFVTKTVLNNIVYRTIFLTGVNNDVTRSSCLKLTVG